ncbi:LysR family transcriptional regulator [Enterovibrio coralii]|uniref:LysR family transcriptional regulator n=1 Tax=Enterovibrio coralii TaxID=294935 RepID=A0A135IDT5_9GAMM|nr:LysR family transcriptional regulator [Enterovibrio coralii]KXF83504.1 LysR family transcriptional regulator [Enterovibrio coralii]
MFSYEHLAAFCATVEEGSYSKAARKLGKDRTTIREQIKAIEDSYAVELFQIEGKKAVVTDIGQAIYRQSAIIVKQSARLDTRLMGSYLDPITYFDIYHDALVPVALIADIEQFMATTYPYIRLNWLHRNREKGLKAVSEGTNQLALMQHRMVNEGLYPFGYVNLGSSDIGVYCHASHRLCAMNDVTAGDLQLEKQYVSENLFNAMPELFSVSPDIRVISNNDILIELLKKDGWAAMSASMAEPWVKAGELKPVKMRELSTALKTGISFFYPEARESAPELLALMAYIRKAAKNYFK